MERHFNRSFFAFSSTIMLITTLFSSTSWAKTIDITNITEPIVAQDGDILTGRRTLEAKISIADGATVTLQNFTHYEAYTTNIKPEPGITCEGNATIILKNENVIEGTNEYPGIYVPENKTLTIQGTGSLAASSRIAPAIGGDTTSVSGDIIIKGGSIYAKGGPYSAAIGSYKSNPCGNITISGSKIIATKGREATYTIGAETSGKITIDGVETGVIKDRQYVYPLRAVHGTFNLSNTTNYAGYQLTDGVTLTGKLETNAYISIADGATITIKDVSFNNKNNSLFGWSGITCEGDATILIDGKDTIQGGYAHAGIFVPESKTLTINGKGNLSVYGGGDAAGIGGSDRITGGNVTILDGTINVEGGAFGAGIGSGHQADFGNITIKGGIIFAKGNGYSSAIGTSLGGNHGDITITGGEVYALGGDYAPSIGTLSKGGNISIEKNATVFAFMNDANPYINIKAGSKFIVDGVEKGTIKEYFFVYPIHTINDTLDLSKVTKAAGYQLTDGAVLTGKLNTNAYITIADGANITLKNATINRQANEFYDWAGITCEGDATINLNGQNSVRPFFGNAGIFVPENKTLTINGQGELNANGNSGAAIGGTSYRKSGNIVINGGTINATGSGGSGIGCGGYGGKVFCGDITINGGTITATSNDAAGIGCSIRATCGNITINGGTIVAKGGLNYAGIGCGGNTANSCGDITINGGTVTATKDQSANSSIGRGKEKSTVGKITIGGVETEDIEASPYTVSYYAINFDANGGTGKTMNNILFIDSENQKLTPNTFTREDCTFNDWNTKADGSGEKYKDGQAVSSSGKEPTTVYLYAQWIKLISSKDISIEIEPQIYTGKKICPDAIVYDIEKALVKDIDYTVECSNNINIGNASITFTGIGNYSGKVTKAFEISNDHITTNIADNFNTHIRMNWDKQTYDLKGRNITNKSKAKGSYYSKQR